MVLSLIVVSLWSLLWKGLALWYSGKNQQKGWFIVMLILNTAGLLPIIYLLWFKPKDEAKKEVKAKVVSKVAKKSSKKKVEKK